MNVRLVLVATLSVLAACGGADDDELVAAPSTQVSVVTTAATPPAPTAPTSAPSTTPHTTLVEATVSATTPPTTVEAPASRPDCARVTDFEEANWVIVNDGVMGGQSLGEGAIADSILFFEGTIVTDGGGFSSVRGPVDDELAGATELVLRVRTDGRSYELLLDDEPTRRQRVTHYAPVAATGGEWEEVVVPLTGMDARVFGRQVEAAAFQPDLATEIGIILSDGVDGPFLLEVDWIDACA